MNFSKLNPYKNQGNLKFFLVCSTFLGILLIITGLLVMLFAKDDFSDIPHTVLLSVGVTCLVFVLLLGYRKK